MTENAERFIFHSGVCMGIIMGLSAQELEDLRTWAEKTFPDNIRHVRAMLEAEQQRRSNR